MLKRIIAIAVAVLMVMSMAVIAVSAAEVNDSAVGADSSSSVGADTSSSASGGGDLVYFDAAGWKSFNKVYCHIWVIGGDSFHGWQTDGELCTKVSPTGTKYSYDLSKLESSIDVSGGMKSGGKYGVIFSANTGVQTYDATIGTECKGDTAYLTGEQVENPVDSNKKGYECVWEKNSGKYGPHLALTSIGNVVGSKLAPGETGIQVLGDWTPTYFNSPNVDAVKALAGAYSKFGVSTIDDLTKVYAYVLAKSKDGKVDKADLKDIKKTLEDAFYKAYPSKKGESINEDVAEEEAEDGVESIVSSGSGSGGSSGAGSISGGGSYSGDSSGSGADGQETTIFFVLAGVMAVAAGAMFVSRKKREE